MPVTLICPTCEKEFTCRPSHADDRKYCSKDCMAKGYEKRMTGKNNPNYKGVGFKKCIRCGKNFHDYGNQKYCTTECYINSKQKIINSKRANDGRRKEEPPCEKCGNPTLKNRKHCPDCNPMKPREHHCENCKRTIDRKYDMKFCDKCREKGLHKKKIFSICSACGKKVPNKRYRKYCDMCWKQKMQINRGTPRKKDANHNKISDALEKAGCSIIDASAIGGGFPDLIVGRARRTYLIEIKNPETNGKLNDLQKEFFEYWTGHAAVAYTIEEALEIVGLL